MKMTTVKAKKKASGHKGKTHEVRVRPTDNGGFVVSHQMKSDDPERPYAMPDPTETAHEDAAGMHEKLQELFPGADQGEVGGDEGKSGD